MSLFQTPRERIHSDPMTVAATKRIITGEVAQLLEQTFTDYCMSLPGSESPQHGWNANCRRQGALDLVKRFLSMGDAEKPRQPMESGALIRDPELNPIQYPKT